MSASSSGLALPSAGSSSASSSSPSASPSQADDQSSVPDLLLRASIAEHAERYDDMLELMKQLIEQSTSPLSPHARCLFALACKQTIAPRRAAWRLLITRETQLKSKSLSSSPPVSPSARRPSVSSAASSLSSPPSRELQLLSSYRQHVQSELLSRVDELLLLVSSHLLPALHPKLHRELTLFVLELMGRYGGSRGGSASAGGLRAEAGKAYGEDAGVAGGSAGGSSDSSSVSVASASSDSVEEEIASFLSSLQQKQPQLLHSLSYAAQPASSSSSSPSASSSAASLSLVFYYKMQGDLRRYAAEASPSSSRSQHEHSLHAHICYSVAAALSRLLSVPASSAEVLSLAHNRSVFEYEVMMQPERGMRIAKEAYDAAVGGAAGAGAGEGGDGARDGSGGEVGGGEEDDGDDGGSGGLHGDSAVIKQLLKENLTLWTSLT